MNGQSKEERVLLQGRKLERAAFLSEVGSTRAI